jgi:hypothetical protein
MKNANMERTENGPEVRGGGQGSIIETLAAVRRHRPEGGGLRANGFAESAVQE